MVGSDMGVTSRGDLSEGPDPARRQRGQALDLIDASPVPLVAAGSAGGGKTHAPDGATRVALTARSARGQGSPFTMPSG